MPGKNGYEVAQYIRRSPRLAHIPVILLTGAFEPVDQARAAEAGCDGVLAKPFEPQMVIGRVKELLGRSQPASTTDERRAEPAAAPAPPAASWPPAPAAETPHAAAPADGVSDLNDYFDRLDAAFTTMTPHAAPAPAAPSAPPTPSAAVAEIDWFSTIAPANVPSAEPWDLPPAAPAVDVPDLPLSYASPQPATPFEVETAPAFAQAELAPPQAVREVPVDTGAPSAPVPPPTPVAAATLPSVAAATLPMVAVATLPPLADAFAALLAAEEHEAGSPSAAAWPGASISPSDAREDLVDEVARRVLDQLSDRVVRQTVADIVSKVAEQLVRDEIERIKAAIK
jgi:CheY-like chemotaxis protein